jgi:hypothetical protein
VMMMAEDTSFDNDMILVDSPGENVSHMHEVLGLTQSVCCFGMNDEPQNVTCSNLTGPLLTRFVTALKNRLSPQLKIAPEAQPTGIQLRSVASETHEGLFLREVQPRPTAETMFVSHGPFGIVDLGASQTVIGQQQVPELLNHLPVSIRSKVKKVPSARCFDLVTAVQLSVKKLCWCLCRDGMSRFALYRHALLFSFPIMCCAPWELRLTQHQIQCTLLRSVSKCR